jgi:hypothetical protein
MKVALVAIALSLFAPLVACGGVVVIENTHMTWGTWIMGRVDYLGIIAQTVSADPTGVWFDYNNSTNSLEAVDRYLDEGSSWYLVQEGQEFSPATIAANQFPAFPNAGPITIPMGDFFLGATTESWTNPGLEIYGWMKLNRTATAVSMVDSLVAYTTGGSPAGIYVGSSSPVPEPAAPLCAVYGLIACWCRRSRTTNGAEGQAS